MPPPSRKAKKKTKKKGSSNNSSTNTNNTSSSCEGGQNVVAEQNTRHNHMQATQAQERWSAFPSSLPSVVTASLSSAFSIIPLPVITFLIGIFLTSVYYNFVNGNYNYNGTGDDSSSNELQFIQLQSGNKVGGTDMTHNCSSISSIIDHSNNTNTHANANANSNYTTTAATDVSLTANDNNSDDNNNYYYNYIPSSPPCGYYVAKSTIHNSGLGIYTINGITKGQVILPSSSDVVIQFPDPNPHYLQSIQVLSYDYFWSGQEMGGQYEGKAVYSLVPGIGMLANGHNTRFNSILYSPPRYRHRRRNRGNEASESREGSRIDNAGLFRYFNPGAGAISHYWNSSFYASRDIPPNDEIFLEYGSDWFIERKKKKLLGGHDDDDDNHHNSNGGAIDNNYEQERAGIAPKTPNITRPPGWIEENGLCIDNLKVGQSTNKEAGRGAFTTRFLQKDQIVSPAPLVQITHRSALKMVKVKMDMDAGGKEKESLEETDQLLLNYCFGHEHSSILLFPIAPVVNYINHDSINYNVKLRWSNSTQHDIPNPHEMTIQDIKEMKHAGLMLEFVATRDIQEGEEIFLDYGRGWEAAWKDHVSKWQKRHPKQSSSSRDYSHTYASLFDEQTGVIKTHFEQQVEPYPDNLFTSCYYNYNHKHNYQKKVHRWEMTNSTFLYSNLRPCIVLDRHEISKDNNNNNHDTFEDDEDNYTYTVAIQNRYGLSNHQRIPQGDKHIVNNVPRRALTFSGKIYLSDQHYAEAFRHEINLPDDVFPIRWMDLKRASKEGP